MRTIIRSLVLLCALAGAAHAQTQVLCNQGSSKVPCTTPLLQTYVPASIPATKIGGGAVDNTEYGYLDGVTSSIQTQLNAKQSTLTLPLSKANGGFGQDVSTGLTNGRYATVVGGAITIAAILAGDLPTGIDVAKLAAGTVTNTVFGYLANVTSDIQAQLNALLPASSTKLPPTPSGSGGTLYDNGTAWTRLAAGTANYLYQANGAASPSWVNSLTGITISCASNTCSNIANAALTNSSITLTCTGLSGCGTVALGATLSPAVIYGTGSNTATQGNDTRLPPAPTAANKLLYDTGSAYAETAACGTAGTILQGASPPACTATPTISTSLDVPRVNATAGSGTLILNATTGNAVQLSVNSSTVFAAGGSGLTASQPLAMSSQKITGLATATATGDALSYPWITATASFNTLASGFAITAANGTYAGTGLTYTFGGAGTYWCTANVRTSVAVTVGAGANISLKLRNTTTSTDIANSVRIGAYASTVSAAYITTTPMGEVVTVTGADTIEVWAASNTGTTYTARSVDSDTAGYSKLGCVKIAP